MSLSYLPDATAQDHDVKTRRVVFELQIVANATPALKTQSSDLPGVCHINTQGKEDADAVEVVAFTNVDANGTFGVLIQASKAAEEAIRKVYSVTASADVGTIAPAKISGSYLSAAGNIVIQLDSNQDLSSQSLTVLLEVEYLIK